MKVLTLDAGGTNLVFNAVENGKVLEYSYNLKTKSDNLDNLINKIIDGFTILIKETGLDPDAISFCFPGPADYKNGIIGDLENLPFFRGGIPLKQILENYFNVPVFINNDGDMFALGEAHFGFLKKVNDFLEENNNPKRYESLLGVTFGTGFGGGIIYKMKLFEGANSAQGEINRMRSYSYDNESIEEEISKRGLVRIFSILSGISDENLTPKKIANYALNNDKFTDCAIESYKLFGKAAGEAIANAVTLLDCPVVIGGGLSKSHSLFLPSLVDAMNSSYETNGKLVSRMEIRAINFESDYHQREMIESIPVKIPIPKSNDFVYYTKDRFIPVGVAKLDTSIAVALGCYIFAMDMLKQ
ncbi:MAG: ROK family protein [Candidatus Delongbacteria bacterium]|nr:ROK family protein [Candidatus Delongbacteria bacterium]MBN2835595.1 ROK family protein [Candidatus Delongbacteria bacterium]